MAINGTFGDVNALPVTGKDGRTEWVFKLEDLRGIVTDEVYEIIEKLIQVEREDVEDEFYYAESEDDERRSDGAFQLVLTTKDELAQLFSDLESGKRFLRKDLTKRVRSIYENLHNNT